MTRTIAAIVVVAIVAFAGVARADDAKARAQALYKQGQSQYEAGDYAAALDSFQQAYDVLPAPALFFNIAQCYRKVQNHAKAIELLERYEREAKNLKPAIKKDLKQ